CSSSNGLRFSPRTKTPSALSRRATKPNWPSSRSPIVRSKPFEDRGKPNRTDQRHHRQHGENADRQQHHSSNPSDARQQQGSVVALGLRLGGANAAEHER